jgi:lipopolysaccharide/colanic/teichoic acid biosynthesis glycosyltransferase
VEQREPGTADAAPAGRSLYVGKRVLDVAIGLVLSIATLPVVLILAAVSAVKFRTSPFFVQQRVGLHGELFACIKIRSLPATTPEYLDKLALIDHGHPAGWCRFLRRFHLDELPQFWHVVGGSMSLVGPRPMIQSIIDDIPHDIALARQSVRPGITGPWQVSVDGAHSLLTCLDYDETYVRTAGPVLDLKLLALTAAQTIGLDKREREQVFAMMVPAHVTVFDAQHGVLVLPHDPEFADVRNAS